MDSNCENISTSQLKINTIYELKFPNSNLVFKYKLITKHDTTKNYEILYTFIDDYGNKVKFTNSIFKNMIVNEYIESHLVINRIDIPTVIDMKDTLFSGLLSNNKNLIAPIISINSYINKHQINLISDDELYS